LGFSFQQKLIQIRDKTRKHGEILQMTLDGNPEDQQKQVEKSDETKKAENNQPGPIPYDRFKEVNEQLKTAKSQLEELQQEKEKREKAAKEAEEKRSKAQLGSSNYSGKTGSKDITQAVGMTEEEHRKSIGM